MKSYIKTTAGKVAGDPELYNLVWSIGRGRIEWECTGVNRNMTMVRFARIVVTDTGLHQQTIYVKPDKPVQSLLTYD